jgi:hypothetical protein
MQVNTTSLTSALTTALRQSSSSNSDFLALDETEGARGARTTAANSGNAVTGTGTGAGSGLLSARTALDLIGQTQQVAETGTGSGSGTAKSGSTPSSAGTDNTVATSTTSGSETTDSAETLPVSVLHQMQNVANDSGYAATVAQQMAGNVGVLVQSASSLGLQYPSAAYSQWDARIQQSQATVNAFQQQAQALYQSDKAEGKSGAETVADILRLQLSQPQSYWKARDPDNLQGDLKGQTQSALTVLQQAMVTSAQSSSVASSATGQTV